MTQWKAGDSASFTRTVTQDDICLFAQVSGDTNPVHLDEEHAARTRFKRRIAHGMLSAGFISAVLGTKLPGPGAIYLSQSLKFVLPVYPGDTIAATATITAYDREHNRMTLATVCRNQDGKDVLTGEAEVLYKP